MRLSAVAILAGTFTAAAAVCVVAATFSAGIVEDNAIDGVETEFTREGIEWAEVDANGLQVFVHGTAPDEAARFRAITAAGKVVDAARVIDETLVAEPEDIRAPDFAIEILRNGDAVSLIGLVPTGFDRAALIDTAGRIVGDAEGVSDLLETADFPEPEGWGDAIGVATRALEMLPRSKVSVEAGSVAVQAMAADAAEVRRVTARLEGAASEETELALDLNAPRPVISPFALRFVKEDGAARFDACAADTEAARESIIDAAQEAGAEGTPGCVIGLGVPSRDWGAAVSRSIAAVDALGGGSVTFSNADVSLIAAEGTAPELFDEVTGQLERDLPDAFILDAVLPEPPDPDSDEGPTEFTATRSPEGEVQLRGRLNSEMARITADSYARARFGSDAVSVGTRIDDDLPESWSARVLAGLEALSVLANGSVRVTPETIEVRGNTGNSDADAELATLLTDKLGESSYDIDVTYLERLDPTLGIPTPAECVDQIRAIVGARKITFEPGSATLDASAKDILDEIAELLKVCGEIPLEIQGHTDSQGREVMNQQLSQDRAQAVLDQLRQRRVLTASYRATGYGEEEPIADNDTEAGREANRRIEFRLIEEEPETDAAALETEGVEYPAPTGEEASEAAETAEDAETAEEGPGNEPD
ncbi:OmpA-OmpF porin, OOP family [Roseivivax marinus]|uniref:OmpA family protein n=1 Tax=Roseivivax marinus TaxID=1379903 RepID=UPI0008B1FC9D|nr:OmpA family protein [Roseivivax marinus]SEK59216.1 OmpA-OmpF porin, OOP family [Roseivivax marinus]